MSEIGTPQKSNATRILLLGSGELGKEVAIEAMRLGCEVVAADRYPDAPAMQVAHRSHVVDMTSPRELRGVVEAERALPHSRFILVPELEAIATPELGLFEADGVHVVPTARATRLTMDREGIRKLAAEQLDLPTSAYRFCDSLAELEQAVEFVGTPCVVKPVMSSSGKGQSTIRSSEEVAAAWEHAQAAGRVGAGRVICEAFVEFDYEITLLTVRHAGGTSFCAPIGHLQVEGDYRESWQPQPMAEAAYDNARKVATAITDALGGHGVFGVELFVRGNEVLFSEVSPRPHDTGMVTMASQRLSEFALHVRAVLGLAVPDGEIPLLSAAASTAVVATGSTDEPAYGGVEAALALDPRIDLRVFGKPSAMPGRRMAVALASAESVEAARQLARSAAGAISVQQARPTAPK